MSRFIELKTTYGTNLIANVERIACVESVKDDESNIWITFNMGREVHCAVTYSDMLEILTKEKENIPPTPPNREKENERVPLDARAGARACEGFVPPPLDLVKTEAKTLGISEEVAEEFWYYYDAVGWFHKGSKILNWRSLLQLWKRSRNRFAAIDRKKLEALKSNRRRTDNYVTATFQEVSDFKKEMEGGAA